VYPGPSRGPFHHFQAVGGPSVSEQHHSHKRNHPASTPEAGTESDCSACGFSLSGFALEATSADALPSAPQPCLGSDRDSLSEFRALVASVLADGFMPGDPRTFDPITRPADEGDGWITRKNACLDCDQVASIVSDQDTIIGPRHRFQTRLPAIDLDNHGDGPPVWTRDGAATLALIRAAEAADCEAVLVPTPHGLHLWPALPEALPIVRVHWILRALLHRAGIDHRTVELFPSLPSGTPERDAKARPRSHGIRLPGQAGTVDPADPFTDPVLIWQSLRWALDLSARRVDSPAWRGLVRQAAAMERRHKRALTGRRTFRLGPASPAAVRRRLEAIVWTAAGQSNRLLGELANVGWFAGHRDQQALTPFVEQAAREAPGFTSFASLDTQRRLSRWAGEWAACCIAHPPTACAAHRPCSADPGRNARLRREAFSALVSACERAAREHGEAALSWSARKVAEAAGIARTTLARLRFHWRLRLLALLYRRRSEHPAAVAATPTSKGGGPSGCSSIESINLLPFPARSPRPLARSLSPPPPAEADHPLPTLPAPLAPHRWQAAQRARERGELARWLGIAAA
jgi:hypothetical protein